jgi:hypothetical protein
MTVIDRKKYIVNSAYGMRTGDTYAEAMNLKAANILQGTLTHNYFKFKDKARVGSVGLAAFKVINCFIPDLYTKKQRSQINDKYIVRSQDSFGIIQESKEVNYKILSNYFRKNEHSRFDISFNLHQMECTWLDLGANMSFNFHENPSMYFREHGITTMFGSEFPIKPTIDREGHYFVSVLPMLTYRVITQRNRLIKNSNKALEIDWIFDFRTLINDTISLVDITLNKIYIKAKYDPLPGWEFDQVKLGKKEGRRMDDKLAWVRHISGKEFNIESEINDFNFLRELRNHFNHFDPPTLVITFEEAATWFNQIISVGYLLIKIRESLGLAISRQLIEFIVQKEVEFVPETEFKKRSPLGNCGYKSSCW